ncbi:MAG: MinD/ParA family protein [bacterium]
MPDQAVGLRRMAAGTLQQPSEDNFSIPCAVNRLIAETQPRHCGKTICVTSGKGGVGKTQVSVNLGITLARTGKRVILIDADLGMANVDVALGLRSEYHLRHVITGQKTLAQIMIPGPGGIKIIPAASGIEMMANLDAAGLQMLNKAFLSIENKYDYLIIDTGAGLSRTVTNFIKSADHTLIVTAPEPAAIVDAYAVIKVACKYKKAPPGLFMNMSSEQNALNYYKKLDILVKNFLKYNIKYHGHAPVDKNLKSCIMDQRAIVDHMPHSAFSRMIKLLAAKVGGNIAQNYSLNNGFFNRFLGIFNGR